MVPQGPDHGFGDLALDGEEIFQVSRYHITEVREVTRSAFLFAKLARTSSVTPSAK